MVFCETVIGVFRHSLGILPVPAPGPRPRPTPLSELTQSQRRVTLRSLYSTGHTLVNKQVVAPASPGATGSQYCSNTRYLRLGKTQCADEVLVWVSV